MISNVKHWWILISPMKSRMKKIEKAKRYTWKTRTFKENQKNKTTPQTSKSCVRKERLSTIPLGAISDMSTRGSWPFSWVTDVYCCSSLCLSGNGKLY